MIIFLGNLCGILAEFGLQKVLNPGRILSLNCQYDILDQACHHLWFIMSNLRCQGVIRSTEIWNSPNLLHASSKQADHATIQCFLNPANYQGHTEGEGRYWGREYRFQFWCAHICGSANIIISVSISGFLVIHTRDHVCYT